MLESVLIYSHRIRRTTGWSRTRRSASSSRVSLHSFPFWLSRRVAHPERYALLAVSPVGQFLQADGWTLALPAFSALIRAMPKCCGAWLAFPASHNQSPQPMSLAFLPAWCLRGLGRFDRLRSSNSSCRSWLASGVRRLYRMTRTAVSVAKSFAGFSHW